MLSGQCYSSGTSARSWSIFSEKRVLWARQMPISVPWEGHIHWTHIDQVLNPSSALIICVTVDCLPPVPKPRFPPHVKNECNSAYIIGLW